MHFYIKSCNLKWNTTLIYLRASRMSGWYRWRVSRHCHWRHIKWPDRRLTTQSIINLENTKLLCFHFTTYNNKLMYNLWNSLIHLHTVVFSGCVGRECAGRGAGVSRCRVTQPVTRPLSTRILGKYARTCEYMCVSESVSECVRERMCVCVCVMYRTNAYWELIWDIQTMCVKRIRRVRVE